MKYTQQIIGMTLIATVMFLSACGTGAKVNSELLAQVNNAAVVSVKFDRSGQGLASGTVSSQLATLGKWAGKYPDPTKNEAKFYNTFNDRAMKVLDEHAPFGIQSRNTTVKNSKYISYKEEGKNRFFIPKPYLEIGKVEPEKAITLTKALNVDAVIVIKYEFREKKSKTLMVTEVSRSLRGNFQVINKDGEVVLEGASQSEFFEIESGISIGGFEVDTEQAEVYNEMADSFLENFKEDLITAEAL